MPFLSGGNFCRNDSDLPKMALILVQSIVQFFESKKVSLRVTFVLFSAKDYDLFADALDKVVPTNSGGIVQ